MNAKFTSTQRKSNNIESNYEVCNFYIILKMINSLEIHVKSDHFLFSFFAGKAIVNENLNTETVKLCSITFWVFIVFCLSVINKTVLEALT